MKKANKNIDEFTGRYTIFRENQYHPGNIALQRSSLEAKMTTPFEGDEDEYKEISNLLRFLNN